MTQIFQIKKKIRGFTLVEQLVVLTLIVVLVGFGAVRMVQTNRHNELEHATRSTEAILRFLQMKALQDGRVYQLLVHENKRQLILKRQIQDRSEFETVKSSMIRSFKISEPLLIEGERGKEFLFYPDGSTSKNRLIIRDDANLRILFRLKNRIGTVEVSRA